ncbi:MAG: hypothetical protein ACJ8AW_43445, partial [Rhodopila sp.]
ESASRMRIFTLADGGAPVVTDTGLIVGVLAEGTPDGLEGTCYSIFYITKRVADEVGINPLVLPSPLLGLKEGTNK